MRILYLKQRLVNPILAQAHLGQTQARIGLALLILQVASLPQRLNKADRRGIEALCIQVDPPQARERIDLAGAILTGMVLFSCQPAIDLCLRETACQPLHIGQTAQGIDLRRIGCRSQRANGLLIVMSGILQMSVLHLNITQCKSHMAQSLLLLLRLVQVSQLPFHMAQSQMALRLIITTTSISIELDGMLVAADGLFKLVVLGRNPGDYGTTVPGTLEVS